VQATSSATELAIPQDVRGFCESRGILDYLGLAVRLAAQTFEPTGEPSVTLETDPETDEEAVVIDVASPMDVHEAVERELLFTRKWVESVPPDVIGTIRVILNIG
jgi:hypothetical protein